jgi:hypothetical protein
MWISSFQALVPKHNSIGIFHSFKSLLIASFYVKFGQKIRLYGSTQIRLEPRRYSQPNTLLAPVVPNPIVVDSRL